MKYETLCKAPESLSKMSIEQLLNVWELTDTADYTQELAIVRGWLMDTFEHRNPAGFNAWLDQDEPSDKSLRRYMELNRMCLNCRKLDVDCKGTACQTWTGCVFKLF